MHFVVYILMHRDNHWRVLRDGAFVAAFSDYGAANAFLREVVETRCGAGKASKVIFDDEDCSVEYRCRCFDADSGSRPGGCRVLRSSKVAQMNTK
jgi:hypothetical protein